jgi:hypothetical protein
LSIYEAREIELSFEIDDTFYLLTTSNHIKKEDEDVLRYKINKVNQMDAKELKAYYRKVLSNEEFSNKGGAGLGFIDMKKRSGSNLEYSIDSKKLKYKKFTLLVKVEKQ